MVVPAPQSRRAGVSLTLPDVAPSRTLDVTSEIIESSGCASCGSCTFYTVLCRVREPATRYFKKRIACVAAARDGAKFTSATPE